MSVKERMVRIEENQQLAEETKRIQVELELLRKEEEHHRLYRAGIDQALEEQYGLFEDLARSGIIAMFEEVTEQRIQFALPDKLFQEKKVNPPKPFRKPTEKQIREAFRWRPFNVSLPRPQLSKEGEWDNSFVIIAKSNDRRFQWSREEEYPDVVTLKYSPSKILEISGRCVTFQDYIPEDELERTERVEEALAEAFVNPYETPRKSETLHHAHWSHIRLS